jgi:hypothetical protein
MNSVRTTVEGPRVARLIPCVYKGALGPILCRVCTRIIPVVQGRGDLVPVLISTLLSAIPFHSVPWAKKESCSSPGAYHSECEGDR